jgi:hypothetical protein
MMVVIVKEPVPENRPTGILPVTRARHKIVIRTPGQHAVRTPMGRFKRGSVTVSETKDWNSQPPDTI